MAQLARFPVAHAEAQEDAESTEESTEELLPHQKESWFTRSRTTAAGVFAAALVAGAVLLAAGLPRGPGARPAGRPVTVRELLEGPELADVVTENFMSLGHGYLNPAHRGDVRAAVADNLVNISGAIRARHPEDHATLGMIQLSQQQKDSVLRLLGHYSDPRLQRLGNDIAQASAETRAQGGNRQSLKRRLSEKLQPQLHEIRGLCDEIAPGSGKDLTMTPDDFDDLEPVSEFDKWNIHVDVSPPTYGGRKAPTTGFFAARRLTARDTLSGTQDQTTLALQHMEGMLGKTMPQAPARMLLFEAQKAKEAQTTGWERFEQCIMDNMSSLPDLFQCLMKNCHRAMAWLLSKLHLQDMADKFMSKTG